MVMKIFDISQSEIWDGIVKSFAQYDIYYLSGYIKAFQIHGDGEPQLLYYEAENLKAIYVYMKRKTCIEGCFDSVTPYGYGGVMFEGDTSDPNLQSFWKTYTEKMIDEGIVDNFVRYHPVLGNAIPMKSISNVIDLGKTVAFDLSSEEVIWNNIIRQCRNKIRKAEKNGVEIFHGKDLKLFQDFKRIYNATMDKDQAEDYYYFEDAFYESIHRDLRDNYEMFYATLNGEIIAMSIMLYANNQMHYHLSGSMFKYRNLAPTNLLLYKAALWGCEKGFDTLHLGGGVGSGEDSLYRFKEGFNKNSDYQFSIGKEIFNQERYNELVAIRAKENISFNPESQYFPLYRS